MEGPCADSVEKREPASDLAIVVVDSLKRLTPTGRLEKRTRAVQQLRSLLDRFVGAPVTRLWDTKSEGFGCPEIGRWLRPERPVGLSS